MQNTNTRVHKNLLVWQRALLLAEQTYLVTRDFPCDERYGLTAQMRRAAVSVLSNISEGAARRTRAEYIHFLCIARGSLAELEAQSMLAFRLQLSKQSLDPLESEIACVGRLLNAQIASLSSPSKGVGSEATTKYRTT